MATKQQRSLWSRVTSPALDHLTPQTAKAILAMGFGERDRRRIHWLSSQGKERELSDTQKSELEMYLHVGHLLTLMHSKARMALKVGTRKSA